MSARAPLVVDFAPHAIHYAGRSGDRWYVSLVQAPRLLALDDEGVVVQRLACTNVLTVSGGIAYGTTCPRMPPANVKRDPSLGPWETIGWDIESGRELWRRSSSGMSIPVPAADPRVETIPGGLRLEGGRVFEYVDDPRGGPRRRWDWDAVHVESDTAVVVGNMRVLRIPLAAPLGNELFARVVAVDVGELPLEPATVFFVGAERLLVDHPTRGRFWFDVAGTGLAKGDPVEIGGFLSADDTTIATVLARNGQVLHRVASPVMPAAGEVLVARSFVPEPPALRKPPTAFLTLVDALASAGLLDPMSPEQVAELWGEHFGEGAEVDATTAGNVLAAVHPAGAGAARGVVVHDHRFGNETDDVVAELAATLGNESIELAQEGARADALRIRAGDRIQWVSFARGGLEAIVRWMDRRLEEAGSSRRIYAFATGGDDHCFVVCEPMVIAELERRGLARSVMSSGAG